MLSGYLKALTGTNTKVGVAEGFQGACQLIAAFPAGYLADRFRRDKVLRYSSILGHFAIAAIFIALFWKETSHSESEENTTQFVLICIGLGKDIILAILVSLIVLLVAIGLWGTYTGSSNAPLEALYADSTTDENRSTVNQ